MDIHVSSAYFALCLATGTQTWYSQSLFTSVILLPYLLMKKLSDPDVYKDGD